MVMQAQQWQEDEVDVAVVYTIFESLDRQPPRGDDLLEWEALVDLPSEQMPFRVLGDPNGLVRRGFADFGTLPYAAVLDAQMVIVHNGPGASTHTIAQWVDEVLAD